ncbi:hypothetical protein JTE90_008211 [Oedothorax gibbosus]|uniref:Odorant receptor n=1 Tax=Oedothorax gibbosus TaxID=931172 RepID=A0AAV6TUJ1_9ARAC|nr:hypothetical protein JTE90_008211 [Oedothorax gibbosus]
MVSAVYPGKLTKISKKYNKKGNNLLKPILLLLMVFGFNLSNTKGTIFNAFFRFYSSLMVLLYHYFAVSDFVWYFQNPLDEIEIALADSITVWASVCTWDFLFWKRKELFRIVQIIERETEKLDGRHQKTYRRLVLISCTAAWLFVFVFMYISQFIVLPLDVKHDTYFVKSPFYFLPLHLFSRGQINLVIKIEKSLENFLIQGSLAMIVTLYVLLCLNIRMWFKKYGLSCKRNFRLASNLSIEDLKPFRLVLRQFSKRVTVVDNVFCIIVAVWLLMILVTLCVRTLAILHDEVQSNPQMMAMSVMEASRAILTLLSVGLAANGVYQESLLCLNVLEDVYYNPSWKESTYHEIASSRSMLQPAHLTVWKFAILNSSFLMTCIGAMITYMIIGVQLHTKET